MGGTKNKTMSKKIEDYLPYYIGQEVCHPSDKAPFKLVGITEHGMPRITGDFSGGTHNVSQTGTVYISDIKLRLRPLSDMTREEREIFGWQEDWIFEDKSDPNQPMKTTFLVWEFIDLLKMGFDLFGLIEANLAVDKTKEA